MATGDGAGGIFPGGSIVGGDLASKLHLAGFVLWRTPRPVALWLVLRVPPALSS